jgi:hypothetical protein
VAIAWLALGCGSTNVTEVAGADGSAADASDAVDGGADAIDSSTSEASNAPSDGASATGCHDICAANHFVCQVWKPFVSSFPTPAIKNDLADAGDGCVLTVQTENGWVSFDVKCSSSTGCLTPPETACGSKQSYANGPLTFGDGGMDLSDPSLGHVAHCQIAP